MACLTDAERAQLNAVAVKESSYGIMTVLESINTVLLILIFSTPITMPRLEYGVAVSTVVILSIKLYLAFELYLKLKRVSYAFEHVRAFDALVESRCSSYFPLWKKLTMSLLYHTLLGVLLYTNGQSKMVQFVMASLVLTLVLDYCKHVHAKEILKKLGTL